MSRGESWSCHLDRITGAQSPIRVLTEILRLRRSASQANDGDLLSRVSTQYAGFAIPA
jgi:hypothetical protein